MDFTTLLAAIGAFTILSGVMIFFSRRLLHSVVFLALAATGSALLFIYVSQTLAALLQLLVFVGSLCTYLIVAVAMEEKEVRVANFVKFAIAAAAITAFLSYIVYGIPGTQANGNSFSSAAVLAFSGYSAFIFAAALLLFATAIGSIVMMRRLNRMVF